MNCKYIDNFLILIIIFFINSCTNYPEINKNITNNNNLFINKGFTLTYNDSMYKSKKINSKIEERSLVIFQKNLKKNTDVKITNLLNSKSILVKVGKNANYPNFYNSVISLRIKKELNINEEEPYIEIKEISENSLFVAKKAKMFDEEKKVATKVPIEDVQIKDLSNIEDIKKEKGKIKFKYIIKIADFYFVESANLMKSRIGEETNIKNVNINKISNTQFRVFIGPYNNLKSLKKAFNAINILEFENIEIIKE